MGLRVYGVYKVIGSRRDAMGATDRSSGASGPSPPETPTSPKPSPRLKGTPELLATPLLLSSALYGLPGFRVEGLGFRALVWSPKVPSVMKGRAHEPCLRAARQGCGGARGDRAQRVRRISGLCDVAVQRCCFRIVNNPILPGTVKVPLTQS